MKILYVHQYFRTPDEGGCLRSYHLAKGLVEAGHEVTMITAHNEHSGIKNISGIKVQYLKIPYGNHFGFVRRIFAYISFVQKSIKLITKLGGKFDLAYVMTTPLTTGWIALHVKERYNIPYYFEVGDLWPEAPIKMGAINNGLVKKWLYSFEKKCYFEAQRVVALSPAIRNYIEANSPETKVHVLTNFSDVSFFEFHRKIHSFSDTNPMKVGYIGTFGAANHLDYLVNVAKACLEVELPVHFTLMGEGAQYKTLKKLSLELPNLRVLPFGNSELVKEVLEAQDAVYVSFKNLEILNTGSPNKFFDGIAAGKLIILNFGGWLRSLVDKHDVGFYHDPNDPKEFVRKIKVFLADTKLLGRYQNNARNLAERYYDKDLQVQKMLKMLRNEKHLSVSDSEVYILTA
ncbi:MAG: glycosyltransferase family 4 protein [Marinoscillum sp.]